VAVTAATTNELSGQAASPGEAQAPAVAAQGIETKLAEARANLAAAEALGDAALTNAPSGVSPQDIATRRTLLHRLVRLFEQQLSNAADSETVRTRRAQVAREAQAWTRFAESPPYLVLLTDRLRGEIEAEQLKSASGVAAVSTMDQLIGENRDELTRAEEEIRQLNERLEGVKDSAAASVGFLDAERQLRHEALAESRIRLGWLQRQLVIADAGASFTQADLDKVTARIESELAVEGQKITGKRSVTLGKIAMAVLILGLGIWITGIISRVTEPIIIRRLKIEPNQANLIRRWFRAFLVACLVMFSLVSVKIPLTVFAFAGGAIAIGLGFGMQTLLKNFVRGLILLFERPFRVGDVLEVGGHRGTVTQIGLRASVLQLWDGTETLIPNSSLLENNVSNWTYSSRKVRFAVTVGAAYGSDTRRVIRLLSEIAERHGVVEKDPRPQVLLTEFAESALTFELRFWVDVIKGNAAQVGSDLRQMIAGAFAENGIIIAFPQRDLHLDRARPLPVEIVPGDYTHPLAGRDEATNHELADKPGYSI
jgi:small-conductance mechanosensitive channel